MSVLESRERELKIASEELVKSAANKYEGAAELLGLGKSQVHRCCSVNDASNFLNIRHVAELERRSAHPYVTAALCRLNGGVFLLLPEDFGDAYGLPMNVMALVKEVGDVADALREGLADGDLSDRDLALIEAQHDELIDKAVQSRAHVRALRERPVAVPIATGKAAH